VVEIVDQLDISALEVSNTVPSTFQRGFWSRWGEPFSQILLVVALGFSEIINQLEFYSYPKSK